MTITLFSDTFVGEYEGPYKKNLPNGEGTFTYNEGKNPFTLNGKWVDGLLEGKVEISYKDGKYSSISASFKKGLADGIITRHTEKGGYELLSYFDGLPDSYIIEKYDKKDQLTGYDYLYNGNNISSLKKSSKSIKFNKLLEDELYTSPIKVSGTVLKVYEADKNTYIVFKDTDSHFFLLSYRNESANVTAQALVPNLEPGDDIDAYGYYYRINRFEDFDSIGFSKLAETDNKNISLDESDKSIINEIETFDYENDLLPIPTIQLFCAEMKGIPAFDRKEATYNYKDIVKYPFHYFGLTRKITGTINDMQIKGNNLVNLCVKSTTTSHIYYVEYRYKDSLNLGIGDTVFLTGSFIGNEKHIHPKLSKPFKDTYTLYPKLTTSKITIVN